jgi:tetratricopeptide (TPR) repeat protein
MTKIKLRAFTKIEFCVVIVIIAMLAGLLLVIRETSLTEKTQSDLKTIRQLLFDMEFDKAVQSAEAIRQKAGQEIAYFEIVYRLAEAERFDEAQKYVSKIGSAFHRTHQPPLFRVIQSRLAETLAAAGRFDEAQQALKNATYQTSTVAIVSSFLLNANRPDDAIRLLDEYPQNDLSFKIRQVVAARFAKNGNDQKALDIAKSIPLDGWRNGTYRNIIREQLKQDRYQDAVQTFLLIDILRYKQQSVMLFVIYLLEKGRYDEAEKLANRFQSQDQAMTQNSEIQNDPFATTTDEWDKHADHPQKRSIPVEEWQYDIERIFKSFKHYQMDTKTTSTFESNNTVSDVTLKKLLAKLESISDNEDSNSSYNYEVYEKNPQFHTVIKELVKLNRTEEALPYVEYLRKHCRSLRAPEELYRRSSENLNNYWNMNLYYLWDSQLAVGQLDEALLTIRQLHVTDPRGCSEAHRVVAEALFEAGRIDEAKEHAGLAIKSAERARHYSLLLVETLFKIDQIADAQLVFSKIEPPSPWDENNVYWFNLQTKQQKFAHWQEILEKKK